jgi:hypothetical protein
MVKPTRADITREKTLFALWRTASKFPKRKFNWIIAACIGLLLARYSALMWEQPDTLWLLFRKIESTGFTFATSILGFLVAGFTVFVTVTRLDMFLKMAKAEKSGTGESVLKYNLSAFIVTFVHYVCYLFACLLCELFLQPNGLASVAYQNALTYPNLATFLPDVRTSVAAFLLVSFGSWTVYLVMLLKSFIYNVYQVTTTSVAYEWKQEEEAARKLEQADN